MYIRLGFFFYSGGQMEHNWIVRRVYEVEWRDCEFHLFFLSSFLPYKEEEEERKGIEN